MPQETDVKRSITKLKSFREGEQGIIDVIACGVKAVPALRRLLFEREPSGLFQARCRTVVALAALKAYDVLIDFLKANRDIADPVERLGEDAVINAAARALAPVRERRTLEVLLALGSRPALTGVIAALGALKRTEAIPVLIDALGEDASRATAESALEKLGPAARTALIAAASSRSTRISEESESQRRQRLSAIGVLAKIGVPRKAWPSVKKLLHDPDANIAALACRIGLSRAPRAERAHCARRLIELSPEADWMLREEIAHWLREHPAGD